YTSYFHSNDRNIYMNPAIKSPSVHFLDCVNESATGSEEQAYFNNIETLMLTNLHCEGASSIPVLKIRNGTTVQRGGQLGSCGPIDLGVGPNAYIAEDIKVTAGSVACVIYANDGGGQQTV